MKILLDVDNIEDIGIKENRRYILSDYQTELNGLDFKMTAILAEVHPATPDEGHAGKKYKCSACINVNSCILKTEIEYNRGNPIACPFGFHHADWIKITQMQKSILE